MKVMAAGLKAVVSKLYAEGRLEGILGMGGSGDTSIATQPCASCLSACPR